MLVRYLYETKFRPSKDGSRMDHVKQPFGCIVATDADKIGLSFCCPEDNFVKSEGKFEAIKSISDDLPKCLGRIRTPEGVVSKPEYVAEKIEHMKKRAKAYFK